MRTVRFGVMCFGPALAAWEVECIRKLLALEGVEAGLLIVEKKRPVQARRSMLKRVTALLGARDLLWQLYERFFVQGRISALRPVDMSSVFAGIPRLECEVVRGGKFSEYFRPDDIEEIRKHNLDFILRFAFGIVRGEILSTPRYGVWSFHHDDEQRYRGGPPGFWEIYDGAPFTGLMLQRLTERLDGGVVLRKALLPTVSDSYVRNRDAALWEGTGWPSEVCRDLQRGDDGCLLAPPSTSTAPVLRSPDNLQMILFLARMCRNFIVNRLGKSVPAGS